MEVLLVLAGGLIGVVVAFITNFSADNRLKVQLDHEDQHQERERLRAVRNEPIQHLNEVMAVVTELNIKMNTMNIEGTGPPNIEAADRTFATLFKASISMDVIGEKDISDSLNGLIRLFTPYLAKMTPPQRNQLIDENFPKIHEHLKLIEGHRQRLMELLAKE